MKRRVGLMCLLAGAILLNGCGGKYADVKKLNAEFVDIMQAYLGDLEQAGSAQEVARAMNRHADRLEKIWPRMQKQSEKHPELQRGEVPAELKESQQEATAMGMKMAGTFMKIAPHMQDPEVRKAQERIGKIMQGK